MSEAWDTASGMVAVAVFAVAGVVVAVAVVEVVAIGVSGNTVGRMGYKLIVEENVKHQCRDTYLRLPWRIAWAVTTGEFTHDGVGL